MLIKLDGKRSQQAMNPGKQNEIPGGTRSGTTAGAKVGLAELEPIKTGGGRLFQYPLTTLTTITRGKPRKPLIHLFIQNFIRFIIIHFK